MPPEHSVYFDAFSLWCRSSGYWFVCIHIYTNRRIWIYEFEPGERYKIYIHAICMRFFLLHPIHINEIVAWMSSIRNGPCSPPLNWKANVRAARGKSAHGRRAKRKETSTARVAENLWDRQFLSSDCRLPFNFCLFEYMILRSQYNATALYIHICWIFEWCSPCVTHGDSVASWCATNTARALLRAQR